jgi:phosphatidate cytidylyltransferase
LLVDFTSLQWRVLTALILAPLAVLAVLFLPTFDFALALGLILLGAAWEWSALGGLTGWSARMGFVALIAAAMILLGLLPAAGVAPLLLVVTLGWWGLAVWLWRLDDPIVPCPGPAPARLLAGLPVLAGPWLAMTHLHAALPQGPALVLFLLVLIWTADSAAYFAGRRWGKAKLAPLLSPGKTWAGVYGAGGGAALLGLVLGYWLELSPLALVAAVVLCLVTAFISVVGDLFESLLKRLQGLKDSGRLLPGHGGLLDRIDSLTAAAPLFALGLLWLGALS